MNVITSADAAKQLNDYNAGFACLYFVGITLATVLVNAGLTSFEKIADKNPRDLELASNLINCFVLAADCIYCASCLAVHLAAKFIVKDTKRSS
jgi:hypothetical protein